MSTNVEHPPGMTAKEYYAQGGPSLMPHWIEPKKLKIHKVDRYDEALCRTRNMGWVIPEPENSRRRWKGVNCKNCLKKKPPTTAAEKANAWFIEKLTRGSGGTGRRAGFKIQ